MDNRTKILTGSEMEIQVIIRDIRSEIDLEGSELLRLDIEQPGARVICTTGALWLTQEGDPNDHLLKAGQSFPLDRRGTVLVQGMPCGKALVQEIVKKPFYNKSNCASPWDHRLEAGS